ncbi:MAG: Gfo/Idh/MocA family oxidoreductase [Planctomycetes bacterium]|nr:Gfo/Idh/MocA family oxidoreductase [Planctomycetota bacterium]
MFKSTDGRVRVGVVGLGRFGRLHALTLAGLAEARLVALVARREESLAALSHELPGIPGWVNLDEAILRSGADAWVVACSTASHVSVTRRLLAAGRSVLLEKPISEDGNAARSLMPLVQSDSGNLMLGHIVLFNSEFQQLREEVRTRSPIAYLDCVRHRPASIVGQFPGENPLHAAMVHDLYCAQVLFDRREPTSFQARYHRTTTGAIDLALAQLTWDSGAIARFVASYLTPAGMPPRGFDRLEVFGSDWAARIVPNPRPVEFWDAQASWPLPLEIRPGPLQPSGMMAEELRCFCRVVRGEQKVPVGASYFDALQVQQWMDRLSAAANGE